MAENQRNYENGEKKKKKKAKSEKRKVVSAQANRMKGKSS